MYLHLGMACGMIMRLVKGERGTDSTLLYQTFSTQHLHEMRAAFLADRQRARGRRSTAATALTAAFCDGRLAIIDAVLATRGLKVTPDA